MPGPDALESTAALAPMPAWPVLIALGLELLVLVMAVAALLPLTTQRLPVLLLHWFLGWLGQSFAVPLALSLALVGLSLLVTSKIDGWIAAVLAAASLGCILLIIVHRRGHRSARVYQSVLNRYHCPQACHSSATRAAGWRPFHWRDRRVTRIRNLSYGPAGAAHRLDIYLPADQQTATLPVLIQVPGGAWITGSKDEQALPLLNHMAANGWLCFAINYRLGPTHRFPAMLEDVLRAIAWVRAHAREYGGDPDFIAITGGSAGGHLASLAALLRDRRRLQAGFEEADTSVSAVVPIYGRYDFLDQQRILGGDGLKQFLAAKVMPGSPEQCAPLWQLASPLSQVHADAPPFFIVHGAMDSMIPVAEARTFHQALAKTSRHEVLYAEVPGAQHAFDLLCSSWTAPLVRAVHCWLSARYASHLATRSASQSDHCPADRSEHKTEITTHAFCRSF